MLLRHLKIQNSGNITFLALVAVTMFSIIFLVIFDICQIFVVREETKNASDAASLAVVQNLLFFENPDCLRIAEKVALSNNCKLVECICTYDEVIVTVEKRVRFALINQFITEYGMVKSTSKAEVVYPWNEQFSYCDSYKFGF